jgi:hypothetical protein
MRAIPNMKQSGHTSAIVTVCHSYFTAFKPHSITIAEVVMVLYLLLICLT